MIAGLGGLLGPACGASPGDPYTVSLVLSECQKEVDPAGRELQVVILDWEGGVSALYPNQPFDPIDFSRFSMRDGGTLADREQEFKEAVRQQITSILCDFPGFAVRLETGVGTGRSGSNVVQFAGMKSPRGQGQIGEGEYDPCNEFSDDRAVIFGEELRTLGESFSFDDWVFVFANVAAHEIGHLFGYGHVERPVEPVEDRSLYVELMYATHTVDEMLREQRLLADITNCPEGTEAGRLTLPGPHTWMVSSDP